MKQNPIRKAGQRRPGCLRVLYGPRPPLRSFTKEMGFLEKPCNQALRYRGGTEGLQPISSEPAPSHRPWASAPGATPKRTSVEHGISRRTRTRMQPRPRSGRRGLGLQQACHEEPPQGGSWYPSAACRPPLRSQLRRGDLGCPRLGRDPSQIGFRLRQGRKAWRVRLLFYVTQRPPFRLPS